MRYFFLLGVLFLLTLPGPVSPHQLIPPGQPGYYPVPRQFHPAEPSTLVRMWYRRYFNREGDPGGVATWTDSLRHGQPEATLATMLASDEYYRNAGTTPQGLIRALFRDLTGRLPMPREYEYWLNRLYLAQRVDVIYDLLTRYPQDWSEGPAVLPEDDRYYYQRPYRDYRR